MRESHRTHVLGVGLKPVRPEPRRRANSCVQHAHDLVVDAERPFAEPEHLLQVRHVRSRNISDRHLSKDTPNVSSERLWSQSPDESGLPSLDIFEDQFTRINDKLIIKSSAHIIEMTINQPVHCVLQWSHNLRNAARLRRIALNLRLRHTEGELPVHHSQRRRANDEAEILSDREAPFLWERFWPNSPFLRNQIDIKLIRKRRGRMRALGASACLNIAEAECVARQIRRGPIGALQLGTI